MWQQDGLLWLLNCMRYGGTMEQAHVVLFKEELTGAANAKVYDDTKLCSFPGYGYIALAFPADPAINGDGDGEAMSSVMTWTRGAGGTPQDVVALGVTLFNNNSWRAGPALLFYDDSFPTVILQNEGETFVRKILFKDRKLTVTP